MDPNADTYTLNEDDGRWGGRGIGEGEDGKGKIEEEDRLGGRILGWEEEEWERRRIEKESIV